MTQDSASHAGDDRPAIIPVCRPALPRTEALLPYLRRIETNGWYSNFGPLEVDLTDRFAACVGLDRSEVLLCSSGTVALSAALTVLTTDRRPGRRRCLMPSWTFVAGVGAALAARLDPYFCDVDPVTWSLDPVQLAERSDLDDVAAVMVTCPFGEPVDVAAWDAFTDRTGIPVLIDAAAAFGALSGGMLQPGRSAMVVSLHATKTLGIGEGGLLLGRDRPLIERAAAVINFGFRGSRIAGIAGINGKMSEFSAVAGHAALDCWPEDRARWLAALDLYRANLQVFSRLGSLRLPTGTVWPTSTLNWLAESADVATALETALAAARIDTRRWWGTGCHGHVAYRDFPRDPLPVTQSLAERCVGLPMSTGLKGPDVDRIVAVFRSV